MGHGTGGVWTHGEWVTSVGVAYVYVNGMTNYFLSCIKNRPVFSYFTY